MGNRFIELYCPKCNEITLHRIKRHFSPSHSDKASARLRRTVTKCRYCQRKIIDNSKKRESKRKHVSYK